MPTGHACMVVVLAQTWSAQGFASHAHPDWSLCMARVAFLNEKGERERVMNYVKMHAMLERDDPSALNMIDESRYPFLLYEAIRLGALQCVRLLLQVKPTLVTTPGYPHERFPLHHALDYPAQRHLWSRRIAIVSMLLAAGADPNRSGEQGTATLLSFFAWRHHYVETPWVIACGRLLIDAGADATHLPHKHGLRIYWQKRQMHRARIALWSVLRRRRRDIPKDVARLMVMTICEYDSWQ